MTQVKKSFDLCSVRYIKQVDVVVMLSTCTLNIYWVEILAMLLATVTHSVCIFPQSPVECCNSTLK